MNWVFFGDLNDTIIAPVLQQAQTMLAGVCAQMQISSLLFATLWLILAAWDMGAGNKSSAALLKEGFIVLLMVSLVQLGTYNQYIFNLFQQGIPGMVGPALGANGSPIAGLDKTLAATVTATFEVYDKLPGWSVKSAVLGAFVLVFLVGDALAIAFCFFTAEVAAITNIVVLLVGPIFLAAGVLPFARRYVSGWASVLVGGCVTQLIALAVIALLSPSVILMVKQVMTETAKADSNSIIMIWGLLKCVIALALFVAVVKRAPSLAQTIGGGVSHAITGAYNATFGVGGAMVSMIATGAQQAAVASTAGRALMGPNSPGAAAARARAATPAAASMSSGRSP